MFYQTSHIEDKWTWDTKDNIMNGAIGWINVLFKHNTNAMYLWYPIYENIANNTILFSHYTKSVEYNLSATKVFSNLITAIYAARLFP